MAGTCYLCGARKRSRNNRTCGFDACKEEDLRRHPEHRKPTPLPPALGLDRGSRTRPLLYGDRLFLQPE